MSGDSHVEQETVQVAACGECKHGHLCCVALRVPLEPAEIEEYEYDERLADKGIYTIKKNADGNCVYFDAQRRRCTIWGRHPRACKAYNCHEDERIVPLRRESDVPAHARFDGKVNVVISIAVLNGAEKYSVFPAVIQGRDRRESIDVLEIRNTPEKATTEAMSYVMGVLDEGVTRVMASFTAKPEERDEG